ncbi:hypothetical protein KC19_12G175500 [Ceratodon purpureus]|uniref:Amine oxidase n=1 Tax=Ceratodon purpureus TaxID=3225 RepID=A0A8T0GAN3_CERPU|nr:hypothetical protein KC19_12G175500 [Ceratodon purpureus]
MAHSNSMRVLPAACLILSMVILLIVNCTNKSAHSRICSEQKGKWSALLNRKAQHPLDPLTHSEMLAVQTLLRNTSLLGKERQVLHSVELEDPDKQEVLRWKPGQPIPTRHAEVILTIDGVPRKIVVDVGLGKIVEDTEIPGSGYPPISVDDFEKIMASPATYQPFLDSLAARGLKIDEVLCLPLSPGWYGVPEDENKRLTKLQCFVHKDTLNIYTRPIEGIVIVLDLTTMQVTRYIDSPANKAPIPKKDGTDYRFSAQTPPYFAALNPISIEQPLGPSFTLDGHVVKWANWEFHVRPHGRVGNIISQAKVDGRSVMYQGFLSELFVPYQTPEQGWYFRTYLDAGDYGLGIFSLPLQPLNDCPRHAQYMDAVFSGPDGAPYITPNMICIFERYAGDIAWQHAEVLGNEKIHEARAKVTLVVRMIASLGNYDYIVDWEFQTDGVVRVKVGATGVLMIKATDMTSVDANVTKDELDDMRGTLISENTIGVIHDHFLAFHMDLDVDGPNNSFVQGKFVRYSEPPEVSPRRSYWAVEKHVAKTEEEARIQFSLDHPSEFYVVNPGKKTRLGNQVSYRVVPGTSISSLLDPRSSPQTRAAFTNNQMWITQYNRTEKYAAGFLTSQSHGDDGLAVWSNRNRNIEDTDITLWYILGFHHVPCQEDFPVMPTAEASFEIKPTNFFERNPILKMQPNH